MGNGWYKITDFTPDADGTWCTEWAVTGAYTIHYPYKEFKVGGGQEATVTSHMDFWSNLQEEAQLTAGGEAGVVALPDVVVADLPSGVTITRVIAMLMCRAIENTNAAVNAVDVAAGHVEVRDDTPGTWTTAIDIPDNSFGLGGSTREMGTVIFGDNDISGEVDGNDTYNFEFDDLGVDQNNLNFNDVQTGLRIYFTA
jgi:hypothetical protein